jgi:hypothetical protein
MTFTETVDRYDDLRREWIAAYAGISTMQNRRAELLNRRIRRRNRDLAGARPDPYDDHATNPLLVRAAKTPEAVIELVLVVFVAIAAPIGWPVAKAVYTRIEELIPDRLRSYPIPALLWAAAGLGTFTSVLYAAFGRHSTSLTTAVLAPWILAQLPAACLLAGIYGILNGWLAIDGSTTWWPLAPPPVEVDFNVPLAPDDLTFPPVFDTAAAPWSSQDQTPISHAPAHVPKLIVSALFVCAIGTAWTTGAVVMGAVNALTAPAPMSPIGM